MSSASLDSLSVSARSTASAISSSREPKCVYPQVELDFAALVGSPT